MFSLITEIYLSVNSEKVEHSALRAKARRAARNNWVINYACYNLLVNLSGLVGYTGGHVLGNFSVTKQRGETGTGFMAKIKDLQKSISDYQVVLESGGKVIRVDMRRQ